MSNAHDSDPAVSELRANVAERRMTRPPDLETRVTARKTALIAEIIEHKLNSSRAGAAGAIDTLRARLSELAHIVTEGVVDGWANVGPTARTRLDQWMAK